MFPGRPNHSSIEENSGASTPPRVIRKVCRLCGMRQLPSRGGSSPGSGGPSQRVPGVRIEVALVSVRGPARPSGAGCPLRGGFRFRWRADPGRGDEGGLLSSSVGGAVGVVMALQRPVKGIEQTLGVLEVEIRGDQIAVIEMELKILEFMERGVQESVESKRINPPSGG